MLNNKLNILFHNVKYLKSVGDKTEHILAKIGCNKILDLITYLPISYQDFQINPDLLADNDKVILNFTLNETAIFEQKGKIHKITIKYNQQYISLIYFRKIPLFITNYFKNNKQINIGGIVKYVGSEIQITHPHINFKSITNPTIPIYSLTYGLTNHFLHDLINNALKLLPEIKGEWQEHQISFSEALKLCHQQNHFEARKRLAYDEFLAYHLKIMSIKNNRNDNNGNINYNSDKLAHQLIQNLPYQLTKDQNFVLAEIKQDLALPKQMMRLLQGDVGSGKTIVALISSLYIIENGGQAAIMAPTEILALQHYQTITDILTQANIKLSIAVITSSTKKINKNSILQKLQHGTIDIIIGTHSLIQSDVNFNNLQLVIIDEQHRFGVSQRQELLNKGNNPDFLSMSATPIPRTLALALYGDMDISQIKTKPSNRKDIITSVMNIKREEELIPSIKNIITKNEKIYWICPLIEESENFTYANVNERYLKLKEIFGDKVAMLTGNMKPEEKEQTLNHFANKSDIYILVATTVVEVGVNVPDATIIIIEDAQKFGLAQLHQLRGRVGRSDKQSYCVLLYNYPISETGKERLDIMRKSNDGFLLAEHDLKLRGHGEIFGLKQSGVEKFRIGDIEIYNDLFLKTWHIAKDIYQNNQQQDAKYKILQQLFFYL
jgi:ATP-dependent DNA helicase RecG